MRKVVTGTLLTLLLTSVFYAVVNVPVVVATVTSRTYTVDADFDEGNFVAVEHDTVHNQLQLRESPPTTLPFIWIPNNDGTVSKINTETGNELARYRVAWPSFPAGGNPSRTTVDLKGNCWVGNRQAGTVVKIGLVEAGEWIDRNGNGVPDTSQDTNSNGNIDPSEVLAFGQDEAVLYEVFLKPGYEQTVAPATHPSTYAGYDTDYWGVAPRGLAVDGGNNLWAGTWSTMKYYHINGETGAFLHTVDVSPQDHNAYGAVLDRDGILWSAELGSHVLALNTANFADRTIIPLSHTYGLGLDYDGHLFVGGSSYLSKIDINTRTVIWTKTARTARGVVATADNNVWVAGYDDFGVYTAVSRYDHDGNLIVTIGGFNAPSGVAVDAANKIWGTNIDDNYIRRIDPATNSIDLSKNVIDSGGHYTYSDMTGIVSRSITTKIGTWTVIFDSEGADNPWGKISWTGSEPPDTSITVRVRSSNVQATWSTWETASNGVPLSVTPNGRYLQIETTLQRFSGTNSPILYDLTVEGPYPTHDVAVTDVKPSKTVVGQGFGSKINVTVANQGTYDETFDVSLYADSGQAMSEAGLVGYWKFDEGTGTTAHDSSGNNNNGVVSGATWTGGKIGNALQFDGTNDYAIVPNSGSLNLDSDKISITSWVKVLGDGTRNGIIVCKQAPAGSSDASYSLDVYPSIHYPVGRHVEFALNHGSWNAYVSTSALNVNNWYHIAGTYDGSKVRIFINGMLDGEYAATGNIIPKSGPLFFGHEDAWEPPGEYFNGTIDEVKIHNRTLSADEIWGEYQRGLGPVGYWKFDEGSGTTACDASGNANSGTLINGPTWVSGRFGQALSFDGVDDFVEVPDTELWNYGYNDFSISVWMKFNSGVGSQSMIGQSNGGGSQDKWAIHTNFPPGATNNIVFLMRGAVSKDITADWAPSTGVWYHVAFSRESDTWKFYINGAGISSEVFSGAVPDSVSTLKIGTDGELWRYFNGAIDEVKIYNRALSADEIREEYSRTPVAHWRFDEGIGTAAYDSSGNNNNGTLINSPTWVTGRNGTALSFDGINDYVDIAATSSLQNFPQMTIETWIDPRTDGAVIDRGFYQSPYWTMELANWGGGMRWNTGQTTNDQGILQDTTNIPYNKWTHVALVLVGIDSTSHNATWYINGQKKTSAILPTGLNAITSTSNPFLIGKTSHPTYPNYFSGILDEVKIHSRAFSAREIRALAGADLIGYWKLDEGSGAAAWDSSGSGNNGTLVNGPAWVSGRFNKALSFDGIDDRVEVPSSSGLNITDRITIMGWFSLKSNIVNEGIGAGHSLAEKWNVYGIRIDSSGFYGYVSINGDPSAGELGAPIDPSTNAWYHVAYTYDGTQSRIYVNGRLEASKTVTGKIDTSSLPLLIGANDGGGQFNGTIDEVRIYDRTLSASEIWTQYTKTPIATQTVTLESGTSTTITFTWNTSGWAKGNYTISAYASPVPGETDTADNTFVDSTIQVAMVGDVAGGPGIFPNTTPDGKVDIKDLATMAKCYGAVYPGPNYYPNYDLNDDGKIDIKDLAMAAKNYGKIDP